jgi:hypothetical protein
MAARQIVANTEEGGRPYRPFRPSSVTQRGGNWARDLAGDSGNGGVNLRRGGGGGARLRLWGRRWDRLQSWRSLNELDINYVKFLHLFGCLFGLFSY